MADNMIYAGVASTPINPVMDRVYANPMETVREGAEDVHVCSFVAYGKEADHKLYLEPTFVNQVAQADVEYAMKRGMMVIMNGDVMMVPVSMTANKVATVVAADSAVTLVEWEAKAAE